MYFSKDSLQSFDVSWGKVAVIAPQASRCWPTILFVVLLLHVVLGYYLSRIEQHELVKPVLIEIDMTTHTSQKKARPQTPVIRQTPPPVVKPVPVKRQILPLEKPKSAIKSKDLPSKANLTREVSPIEPFPQPSVLANTPPVVTVPAVITPPAPPVNTTKIADKATCTNCPQPAYPNAAKRRNWQGSVRLRVQIDANGEVSNVTVLESSGYDLLDEAAVSGVKQWQFTQSSQTQSRVAIQLINFKLDTE